MAVPPLSLDDPARLAALRRVGLMDSITEEDFDRLTRLAARVLEAPVCLVTLVDDQRQFFKSSLGLGGPVAEARQTPLTHSFCQYVVTSGEPLVVDDAWVHPQVRGNLAIRDLGVRAYLGVPIRSRDGYVLGSFCVIDGAPRAWQPRDIELMEELVGLVEAEITQRAQLLENAADIARQRAVLDGTTYSIIATTPEGMIEVFNEGAARMLGYAREEMVGRQTPAVIHVAEEVKARAAELSVQLGRTIEPGFEAFVALARVNKSDEREWTYVRKDGSRIPVLLNVTALRVASGAIVGFLGMAQDLTARRKAESALQASEERLHRVLSHADCLVWEAHVSLIDGDWAWEMTVHPSALYRRLSGGADSSRSVGLWYQFNVPEQEEMNRRSLKAMEGGLPGYEQEFRVIRAGRTSWLRESVSITPTAPGRFWLVGVVVDTTERKELEAAVNRDRSLLRMVIDLLPNGVYLKDRESRFLMANQVLANFFGKQHSTELVGLRDADLFAAGQADGFRSDEEAVLQGREIREQEELVTFPTGERRTFATTKVPFRDGRGEIMGVLGSGVDITERKRAEVALKDSQRRLEKIFAALTEGLLLQGADGAILESNAAAERILGLTRDQIAGRSSLDPSWRCIREDGRTFPGDEHPAMVTLRTGAAQSDVTMGVHRPDGSLVWIEINTEPIGGHGDPARQVVCSFRDVTVRRAAEEKLAQSQTLLTTVTSTLPGLIAYWTADLRCAFANAEYFNWFGRRPAEMVGQHMRDLFGPELFAKNEPFIRGVLGGQAQRFERDLVKPDGSLHHTWAQYVPHFGPDGGRVIGFAVLVSDISEAKRQEQRLRATTAELAQQKFALDQHAIVAATNVRGDITYVNDRFCEISGYTREEMLGQNHRMIKSGRHSAEFFGEMYRTISSGRVWHGEICNRSRDGTLYWVDATIVPFLDADGKPVQYVAIRTDITQRKTLEQNLAIARDQALEASRLKSEFLATMSHEIRTPMNAIIGMAGLLTDTTLNAEQAEMLQTLTGGAEGLLVIINDILDFSRIEAGQLRLEAADFDLRRIVEETVALLAPRAHEKGVEIVCEFDHAPKCLLFGDGGRMRQILMNLVGNAVKFTDQGEVIVRARVVRETSERVRIQTKVIDTGVGIPEEARGRLFQPFVQVDGSSTRRFGGTGLGLAITRQLVAAMGGEIGFDSEPGRGSLFWVELDFPRRGPLATFSAGQLPAGSRALIVDDNATNRRIVRAQLGNSGVDSEEAADGATALARLRTGGARPFDLVLLDWQMPEMDGLELAMEIRADPALAALPLVMLSSAGPGSDTAAAAAAGFAGFLSKPVAEANLIRCIARVLTQQDGARPAAAGKATAPVPEVALRILLAEDNLANQRVASLLLGKMGHTVEVTANGQQALERLATGAFELVLMDCQMPVLDGYQTTKRIRSGTLPGVNPRIPIIALTAYAREEDRNVCLAAGMDGYVSKPIRVTELQAALAQCGFAAEPPARGRRAAESVLDAQVLATLRSLPGRDGPSLLPELIDLFLGDEPERLEEIVRFAARRVGEELAQAAHAFGGNAASLGGLEVRRLALALESAARAAAWAEVDLAVARLAEASRRLHGELIQLRNTTS